MILQTNGSSLSPAYGSNSVGVKGSRMGAGMTVSKQGDTAKVDSLRESIESGEYKVDLAALSRKIADELL